MNDFAFVVIILASFAALALFVMACDRIIGPDEDVNVDSAVTAPRPRRAA